MSTLNGLSQFVKYDFDKFLDGKKLTLTAVRAWTDYQSKAVLGKRAEVAIVEDKTVYKAKANGEQISNLYNKFTVCVPGPVDIPLGTEVEIVGGEATVYGEYRNQLSVKAASIRPIAGSGGKA